MNFDDLTLFIIKPNAVKKISLEKLSLILREEGSK